MLGLFQGTWTVCCLVSPFNVVLVVFEPKVEVDDESKVEVVVLLPIKMLLVSYLLLNLPSLLLVWLLGLFIMLLEELFMLLELVFIPLWKFGSWILVSEALTLLSFSTPEDQVLSLTLIFEVASVFGCSLGLSLKILCLLGLMLMLLIVG